MKTTFPGHFPPTSKDVDHLWESCLFTLDTNILLNLYRYSDATRNEFIKVLEAIQDRLWLPHRAAEEYFENRLTVISQQEKAYDEAIKAINALQADLSNDRQHPFLSDNLMQKLTQVFGEVVGELTSTKGTHANRTSSDEIQKTIGDLFERRVGPPYSDKQLEAICGEAKARYARKVPPGYKDSGKDEEIHSAAANYRKYGDLILWRQIAERASEVKKSVIFVTDDKKEDWWLLSRGKTLGPRPELVEEFLNQTGQAFYMYQADRFLEYAAKLLKQKIAPESMDEIRDLRRRDLDRSAELLKRREDELELRADETRLQAKAEEAMQRLEASRTRFAYLHDKFNYLQHGQAVNQEKLDRSGGEDHQSLDGLLELRAKAASAEREMAQVRAEIAALEIECATAQIAVAKVQRIAEHRFARARE